MPSDKSPLPFTIERILAEAAADPAFREQLLDDRLQAVTARGYALSETEQAVLMAVPAERLETMIDNLVGHSAFPDISQVQCTGIRPDTPMAPQGIRPDKPESPIVRGTRPGRVALAAAAGVVIAGAAGSLLLVTGSRPDVPPVSSPAEKKAEDDTGDGGEPPPMDAGKKDAGPDGKR